MTNVKQALALYKNIETDLLLAHVLHKPKEFLLLHPEKQLSSHQFRKFKALCQRRLKSEPYAYIVGHKYFYGLSFLVNKNVLIPRPETEWLVDRALQIIKTKLKDHSIKKPLQILDIGTGSGCIAITLAKHTPARKVSISAVDISPAALTIAKKNNQLHRTRVKFSRSNLLKQVTGKFDIIIANLPYVPAVDYKKLKPGLIYEPKLALVGTKKDGYLYTQLLQQLPDHLTEDGIVLLEIDPQLVPQLKREASFRFYKDMHKLYRYAELVS